MKNVAPKILLAMILITFAEGVAADDTRYPENFNIGSHQLVLDSSSGESTYSGIAFGARHAFNNQFAVRYRIYSDANDDNSDVSVDGQDLQALIGGGFEEGPFMVGATIGAFTEEIGTSSYSESFSGLEIGLMVGLSYKHMTLEFMTTSRNSEDYDDAGSISAATTTSLSLGFRF